jgi:hypothetical protein
MDWPGVLEVVMAALDDADEACRAEAVPAAAECLRTGEAGGSVEVELAARVGQRWARL